MADDHQDKIEQIRARRSRDSVQLGYNPYDVHNQQTQQQTAVNAANNVQGVNTDDAASILGADFKSPWLRDRVTLSLEGQIAMMEQRTQARYNVVDLGYSNRNSSVSLNQGMSVEIEPPGTYKLVYNKN